MPSWLSSLPTIVRDDLRNGEVFAVAVALTLILLLLVTLPKSGRRLMRSPIFLLVAHLSLRALRRTLFTGDSNAAHILVVLGVLTILACIGRSAVTLVLDVGFGRRMSRPTPRIIRDVVMGVVYIGIALVSLRAAGIEPGSILTTSALLTAVVGFSLQETMGNLFNGLALQLQAPFEVGDWIQFSDGQSTVGKVLEINWRATKLLTLDEVEVIVPNGKLGTAAIANYTKPSPRLRRSISVTVTLSTPPRKAQRVIAEAIKGSFGVLDDPAPSVVTQDFNNAGTALWVRFWTDQFQRWGAVEGEVRDRIWYALAREGIEMAWPTQELFLHEVNDEMLARQRSAKFARNVDALRAVDFLAALPASEIEKLARSAEVHLYAEGEVIVKKGDTADDMYIVQEGEVAVLMPADHGFGEKREVAKLDAGKFFGEMALMTGEPRSADVVARKDSELVVVSHGAFHATLAAHPELAKTVSRIIAERQQKLDEHVATSKRQEEAEIEERTSQLLGKIKRFFSI
ncbi:MAG TPA: mechanosensitive ion channel family protein [Polyangiaceae bacterium]